ncbi:MAG TPA: putative glycolipid-binding domain-containing protein [Streptosporangiaceae bacterium]|jgi:hypothetical protein
MPIMRHELLATEGQVELTMAWVSVPDLTVEPDGQRYTSAGRNRVRYDALDGGFSAIITMGDDGLVADYPGVARRI